MARGDSVRERLAGLYAALKDDLFTVASHLTGERHAAEDVVHDVFAAAAARARELPPFATLADARRYFATACAHRVRDRERRRRPQLRDDLQLDGRAAGDGDPLLAAAAADDTARLRRSLELLPPEQRAVVTLRLHGGLTFREVAAALAIPPDTAAARYRYALEKLARALRRAPIEE